MGFSLEAGEGVDDCDGGRILVGLYVATPPSLDPQQPKVRFSANGNTAITIYTLVSSFYPDLIKIKKKI